MDSPSLLQVTTVAGILIGGMGAALLGTIKLALAARLKIDEDRVGGLVSLFGFVMIPTVLVGGVLTDLGKQPVLVGGCVLLAVSVALLGSARTYAVALGAVVLLSASWATLVSVVNPLMPIAWSSVDPANATNLGNVFFCLGGFLTPIVLAAVVHRWGLPRGLAMAAGAVAVGALLALVTRIPPPSDEQLAGWAEVLSEPIPWLCTFTLFFYGPVEASLAAWTTTYLKERGVAEEHLSRLLAGFWFGMMASRALAALTLIPGTEAMLLFFLAVVATAVLTGMVLASHRGWAATLVIAAGFTFGPIFPTMMGILFSSTPPGVGGRATAMVFSVGAVGWTVIPALIGAYARKTSIQRAFRIAVASSTAVCVVTLVMVFVYEPDEESSSSAPASGATGLPVPFHGTRGDRPFAAQVAPEACSPTCRGEPAQAAVAAMHWQASGITSPHAIGALAPSRAAFGAAELDALQARTDALLLRSVGSRLGKRPVRLTVDQPRIAALRAGTFHPILLLHRLCPRKRKKDLPVESCT